MSESKKERIQISTGNIAKYGFAVFYHAQDHVPNADLWERDLVINIGLEEGNRTQTISIPKQMLVRLSQAEKIVNAKSFSISQNPDSWETIRLLLERAGWNQTSEDLKAMLIRAQTGTYISTYRHLDVDISLGSGVALPLNDRLSWIGMILVHPELRRQGIASAIMDVCLNHARSIQEASIVGLDATPLGKQVYDSLGFKDSFSIWRCLVSTNCTIPNSSLEIEDAFKPDLIDHYLKRINYTERADVINQLGKLKGSECIIAKSIGKVVGFALSRPGRIRPFIGPLIADTKEVAYQLLSGNLSKWNSMGFEDVFMDVPVFHLTGSIFYTVQESAPIPDQHIQVQPSREFIRMYQLTAKAEKIEVKNDSSEAALLRKQAIESYDETMAFMMKEKQDVLPYMYGTGGPEWS